MTSRRNPLRRIRRGVLIASSSLLLFVLAAAVLDVAVDAPLRRYMEEKINSKLRGYTVHVGRADFHVLGLSLDLEDCTIHQNAHPEPPVASIPGLSASVQWKALLSAHLVADFIFTRPEVHINLKQLSEENLDQVPVNERGWQDALQAVYPLKINNLEVFEGTLTYEDEGEFRPLRVSHVRFHAGNIRNAKSTDGVYPSDIHLQGVVFDTGSAVVDGHADFLAKPHPGFNASLQLRDMELSYFEPVTRRHGLRVKDGWLDAAGTMEYASSVHRLELESVTVRRALIDYVDAPETRERGRRVAHAVSERAKEMSNSPNDLVRIDQLDVIDSEVGYVNETTTPPYRVFVTRGSLTLRNLSNQNSPGGASADLKGQFMGTGHLDAHATFRTEGERPSFNLGLRIEGVQMPSMNDLFRAYAKLDVARGEFSLYSELGVRNGLVSGYVKPLFKNLDVYDARQDRTKSGIRKVYEKVVGGLAAILKNRRHHQVATVTTISGPVENTRANTIQIIVGLIRNAFFKAIVPGFEGSHRKVKKPESRR